MMEDYFIFSAITRWHANLSIDIKPHIHVFEGTSRKRSGNAQSEKDSHSKTEVGKTKLRIWAQNYNAFLKLRPTLVKVTNFDTILYR